MYINNRARLTAKMKPGSIAIVNSNDEMPRTGDQTFGYRQNSDLFYLTGLDQEKCILVLCPGHPMENMREILFTVKTSDLMVTWNGYKYTFDDVRKLSGIKTVRWIDDFDFLLKEIMSHVQTVYLNQNEYIKFFTEVPYRDLRFAEKMRREFPVHTYERLAPLITPMRTAKQPGELEQIKTACNITGDAFRRILKFVKPGMMEYQVEAEMIHEFISRGCNGHSFSPIIASGKNSCILHYVNNDLPCKDGDVLLLDFGAEYGLYGADMTRTIPVNGKFSPRQRQVYEAVLRVLKAGMTMLTPGNTNDNWHKAMCSLIEKELVGLGLITEDDIKNQDPDNPAFFKYYMHGSGHFLGLDVHDVGTKQQPFEYGAVMTCEPGIYIPEEGIGVRLENDVIVADKPINLMENIPVEPDEIEAIMQSGR